MITFRLDGSPPNGSLPQIKVTLGPTFRVVHGHLTASLPHTDVTLSLLTVCICMLVCFRTCAGNNSGYLCSGSSGYTLRECLALAGRSWSSGLLLFQVLGFSLSSKIKLRSSWVISWCWSCPVFPLVIMHWPSCFHGIVYCVPSTSFLCLKPCWRKQLNRPF